MVAAIIERVCGEEKVKGLRFLIPRARVARDLLPNELTRLGAEVDVVEAYRTVKPDLSSRDIVKLFLDHRPDAITFTSSSTVSNLAALAGTDDLSALLRGVVVACIGPITAQTAAEHGLRVDIQPASHNALSLAQAIVAELGSACNKYL